MKYLFVALVCMFAIAQAQETEVVVIDPFTVNTPSVVIVLPSSPTFPTCQNAHTQDASIIGGERGIEMCATEGSANAVLTAGTAAGSFSCSAPGNAGGVATLQYDGQDGDIALDPSGLFSDPENDWTVASAFGLRTLVRSDFATTAELRVYSGSSSDYCTATISIPQGSSASTNVLVEYPEFSDVGSGCDFSNIGAFEVIVDVGPDVDVVISQIAVVGPIIYNECTCVCPEFTCIIAIDHDDDGFIYYATSDFNENNNPTTDLSTYYSSGDDDNDDGLGLSTLFSSDFTFSKTSGFSTITTFQDLLDDDDSSYDGEDDDDDDDSGSGSSSSNNSGDDDDDSSAATIAPALALVVIAMALVL